MFGRIVNKPVLRTMEFKKNIEVEMSRLVKVTESHLTVIEKSHPKF